MAVTKEAREVSYAVPHLVFNLISTLNIRRYTRYIYIYHKWVWAKVVMPSFAMFLAHAKYAQIARFSSPSKLVVACPTHSLRLNLSNRLNFTISHTILSIFDIPPSVLIFVLSFTMSIFEAFEIYGTSNSLIETEECVLRYRPDGFHPAVLGETLKGGRYQIYHKRGFTGLSTTWVARDKKYVVVVITGYFELC